jgi:hypothetical protein
MSRNGKMLRIFEALETRRALAVAAEVVNGSLVISGESDGVVAIVGSASGEFTVTDNGSQVASLTGITKDIRVNLPTQGADDAVSIDLGGQSIRSLYANLGGGENALTVGNGVINGVTSVRAGQGADAVALAADLTMKNETILWLGGGDNKIEVDGQLGRGLDILTGGGDDSLTLAQGSSVSRGVRAALGNGDNSIAIDGAIGRELALLTGSGDDIVAISELASIGRGTAILLGGGANQFTQGGNVGGKLALNTGNGDDTVTLAASSNVAGNVAMRLGEGTNSATIDGTIGKNLAITSATSTDTFTVAPTATIGGAQSLTPGAQILHGQLLRNLKGFAHNLLGRFGVNVRLR